MKEIGVQNLLPPIFLRIYQESVFNMNADDDLFPNQYVKFLHKYTADMEFSSMGISYPVFSTNFAFNLISQIFSKYFFKFKFFPCR